MANRKLNENRYSIFPSIAMLIIPSQIHRNTAERYGKTMWENPIKMEMPKTKDTLATWRQANFAVQPDKRVNRMGERLRESDEGYVASRGYDKRKEDLWNNRVDEVEK